MTKLPVVQQGNVLMSQVFGVLVVIHFGDDTSNPLNLVKIYVFNFIYMESPLSHKESFEHEFIFLK